jgi:hypothetical protein
VCSVIHESQYRTLQPFSAPVANCNRGGVKCSREEGHGAITHILLFLEAIYFYPEISMCATSVMRNVISSVMVVWDDGEFRVQSILLCSRQISLVFRKWNASVAIYVYFLRLYVCAQGHSYIAKRWCDLFLRYLTSHYQLHSAYIGGLESNRVLSLGTTKIFTCKDWVRSNEWE